MLLHRPDMLVEPEEVAEAFDELESSGKVRYFGVPNHKPAQIQVLSGTMTVKRFEDICKGADITLTKEEWYEIYMAAGNLLP